MRSASLFVAVWLLLPVAVLGQTAGPYVAGFGGVSAGDGGGAPAVGGAVGYTLPRGLAFELEIGITPALDFGDFGVLDDFPTSLPIPRPVIEFDARLLTFQVNVSAKLSRDSRLRVYAVGGGGAANLETDVHYQFPQIIFPPDFFENIPSVPGFPPFEFDLVERRFTRSENALMLNAGGIVEYAWTERLGLGVDARYCHGFFNREALKNGRITARLTWRF